MWCYQVRSWIKINKSNVFCKPFYFGYRKVFFIYEVENGAAKFDTIAYDHRNLPTRIVKVDGTEITYRYNAAGQRIFKKVGSQTPEYYIMDGDQTVAVYQNGSLKYWNILANGVVGRYEPGSGSKFYYLKDHLGSTRAVVNSSGTVVEAHDYYPFGLLMPGRDYQSAERAKELFTGKERDGETGLDYFGARYYWSGGIRWLSVDPRADDRPWESPYIYTGNNPVSRKDKDGEFWNIVIGAGIGAALDAGIQIYQNYQKGNRGWDVVKNINVTQTLKAAAIGAAGAATGIGIASATSKIVQSASITSKVASGLLQGSLNAAGNATANVAIGAVASGGEISTKQGVVLFLTGAAGSVTSDALKAVGSSVATKKAIRKAVDYALNNEAIGDASLLRAATPVATQSASGTVQGVADALVYSISNIPTDENDEEKDKNK